MGAVYRAIDTKLGREVAIKVLPPAFAEDADRMARFTREERKKFWASLNHPNIAQIYGIEERALVMELVPGATLKPPLPLETALNYAKQIAEALEAAHERGIVHRDLKPANMVVTPEGVVKLLDFGLAAIALAPGDPLSSPTITMQTAQSGVIMGTAAYMSPRTGRRKTRWISAPTCGRSAWVLWEMLTGRRLFAGETISLTLAGVLGGPIDFDKLPRETPPPIRAVLRRCLDRNVRNRLRDIGEARVAIESSLAGERQPIEQAPAAAGKNNFMIAGLTAALMIALALAALVFWRSRGPSLPRQHFRFQVNSPEGELEAYRLSPDGRFAGYTVAVGNALRRVFIRSLDGLENRPLIDFSGTTNFSWFWSPDGEYVAYHLGDKLYKIARSGGQPVVVADVSNEPMAGAWLDNDVILLGTASAAYRVSASGGAPVKISDQRTQAPAWLPGKRFLYVNTKGVFALSVDGGNPIQILPDLVFTTFVEPPGPGGPGYLVFFRAGTIFAQPFDADKLELRGNPIPIVEHAAVAQSVTFPLPQMACWRSAATASQERVLTWLDRSGRKLTTVGKPFVPLANEAIRLSPDESKALVPIAGADGRELWMADLKRNAFSKFALQPSWSGIWSPDGQKVLWAANDGNRYLKSADGSGPDELYFKNPDDCIGRVNGCGNAMPNDWSPDGKFIVVNASLGNGLKLWLVPTGRDRKPYLYRQDGVREYFAQVSPDSRWMAYEAQEPSSSQPGKITAHLFIESIPSGRGRWEIATQESDWAMWRRDGKELFFVQGRKLMAVPVRLHETSVEVGDAQALFELRQFSRLLRFQVSRDGQRFLIAMPTEDAAASRTITVDTDWRAGLSK